MKNVSLSLSRTDSKKELRRKTLMYSMIARFNEYNRQDKVYLSVVENEDTRAEFGTTLSVNVGLLPKSVGYDPSKSKKNTRGHISNDESVSRAKILMLNRLSTDVHLTNRGEDTVENNNSNQDLEVNFKHRARKKCNTVGANTSRLLLGDSFLNDIQSCSYMPTSLEDVPCLLFYV
ncbi:LOW QUALITY PROTEIN: hypothetical protein Cgig2_001662 [Carnegiea gigantea]|uniref:Uncharacterized protein n=1 Tax=Carnegiea gigantea TaxID=171969 RepID=A0A9Q1JY62_9CARY|nr:LOW QUALITY PROTEIN: hypothetical protein Cgig2_001662 [Carnegiea gigantea]